MEVWRYRKRSVAGRAISDYEDLLSGDDPAAEQITDYTLTVLDALENRNGAGRTEVMLTPDDPVLVACGARLGGGQMPELLSRCTGTNQVDSLAEAIAHPERFTAEPFARYRLITHLCCVNLISHADGTMPHADAWEPARKLALFHSTVLNAPEGACLCGLPRDTGPAQPLAQRLHQPEPRERLSSRPLPAERAHRRAGQPIRSRGSVSHQSAGSGAKRWRRHPVDRACAATIARLPVRRLTTGLSTVGRR